MKKEFIYFTIAFILFCVGFLLGKTQNNTGKYFLKIEKEGIAIFDTSNGVVYYKDSDAKRFYMHDIKNATKVEYKEKK